VEAMAQTMIFDGFGPAIGNCVSTLIQASVSPHESMSTQTAHGSSCQPSPQTPCPRPDSSAAMPRVKRTCAMPGCMKSFLKQRGLREHLQLFHKLAEEEAKSITLDVFGSGHPSGQPLPTSETAGIGDQFGNDYLNIADTEDLLNRPFVASSLGVTGKEQAYLNVPSSNQRYFNIASTSVAESWSCGTMASATSEFSQPQFYSAPSSQGHEYTDLGNLGNDAPEC